MSILELVKKYGIYRELTPGEYAGPCPECGGAVRFRILLAENRGKCQSCSFVLSGQLETAGPTAFDADKMRQMISDTQSRVKSQRPDGAAEWLTAHRPDVTSHLLQAGKQVDAAYEDEDVVALQDALELWEKWHLAAWDRYKARPPVLARCKMEGGGCVCCGDCREGQEE